MADNPEPEDKRYQENLRVILFNIFGVAAAAAVTMSTVWPTHHGRAIMLGAVILSLDISYLILRADRHAIGWALATSYTTFCGAYVLYTVIGGALPIETELHGWLRASNDPPSPTFCDRFFGPGGTKVFMGNTILAVPSKEYSIVALAYDKKPVIALYKRSDGHIAVDADLYDAKGELAVHIVRNEFKIIPGHFSYANRSADRSELEVMDPENKSLLYVRYANRDTIEMSGHFFLAREVEISFDYQNGLTIQMWKDGVKGRTINTGFTCGFNIGIFPDGSMEAGMLPRERQNVR